MRESYMLLALSTIPTPPAKVFTTRYGIASILELRRCFINIRQLIGPRMPESEVLLLSGLSEFYAPTSTANTAEDPIQGTDRVHCTLKRAQGQYICCRGQIN